MLRSILAFIGLASVAAILKVPFKDNRVEEIMLPMRDGVNLHTVIVFPRAAADQNNKFTTIIDRSPYGYSDLEWFVDIFVPLGYVAIGQDMRGCEKSEGNFSMWGKDGNDSRDLGDWVVSQEWSNGQIFTFGASAAGIGSLQTARTNPDWLKAQVSHIPYDSPHPTDCFSCSTLFGPLLESTIFCSLMVPTNKRPPKIG